MKPFRVSLFLFYNYLYVKFNNFMEFNNGIGKTKVPINRNNLFYSEESYQFEQDIAKDYVETDMNQTLVLYRVDISETNLDSTYNETGVNNIRFKQPKEFHCVYKLNESEEQAYNKTLSTGVYIKPGKLEFGVMQATLDELDLEINIGDYVCLLNDNRTNSKWPDKLYFCVADDGRGTIANSKTVYGYKPFYRHCVANFVDENEFNGK
jgi:hypothetical protein